MEYKKRNITIRGRVFEIDVSNKILKCIDNPKLSRVMDVDMLDYYRSIVIT